MPFVDSDVCFLSGLNSYTWSHVWHVWMTWALCHQNAARSRIKGTITCSCQLLYNVYSEQNTHATSHNSMVESLFVDKYLWCAMWFNWWLKSNASTFCCRVKEYRVIPNYSQTQESSKNWSPALQLLNEHISEFLVEICGVGPPINWLQYVE